MKCSDGQIDEQQSQSTDTRTGRLLAMGVSRRDLLLTAEETADLLAVSTFTLSRYRALGKGPAYVRLRGHMGIRYRLSDVRAWLDRRTVIPNPKNRKRWAL